MHLFSLCLEINTVFSFSMVLFQLDKRAMNHTYSMNDTYSECGVLPDIQRIKVRLGNRKCNNGKHAHYTWFSFSETCLTKQMVNRVEIWYCQTLADMVNTVLLLRTFYNSLW